MRIITAAAMIGAAIALFGWIWRYGGRTADWPSP
jgi:hypothetical protein